MVGFACYTVGCQRYPAGLPIIPPTNGDFLAVVGDEHLPLLEAFHQSGQSDLPPVLTLPVPLKGMLIPTTRYAAIMRRSGTRELQCSANRYREFTHAPLPPAERYTSNPRPFVLHRNRPDCFKCYYQVVESGDYLKPSPLHLNQNNNSWELPVAPLLKVLVPVETRTGRR